MNHEQNLFAFSEKFPVGSQERNGLVAAAARIVILQTALVEARDLLLEKTHGNPARSAGHNARLIIEAALR
jgi:hypothetical protein